MLQYLLVEIGADGIAVSFLADGLSASLLHSTE